LILVEGQVGLLLGAHPQPHRDVHERAHCCEDCVNREESLHYEGDPHRWHICLVECLVPAADVPDESREIVAEVGVMLFTVLHTADVVAAAVH